jgi:DnaJ-class molecular chaperone
MNGEAGKGSAYRRVNQKKYDQNYLRVYGVKCGGCHGSGRMQTSHEVITGPCSKCNGSGYIKRRTNATRKS